MFWQLFANGLVTGSVIAIAAVGVSLVYGILQLINFAHGDVFALSGLFATTIIGGAVFNLTETSTTLGVVGGLTATFLIAAVFGATVNSTIEFVAYRQNWGEDRVHLHDENGRLFSLPAGWTDVAAADPFVVVAAGRCPFTVAGLLALADLADRSRARRDGGRAVKKITP